MAAQIHFAGGREPSQMESSILLDEKRRLGQVIFGRDGLHDRIRKPCFQRADSSRVAGKDSGGKGVHLKNRDIRPLHELFS